MSKFSQTDPTTVIGRRCAGGRSGLHLRIQCTTESVAVKISPRARLATCSPSRPTEKHVAGMGYSLIARWPKHGLNPERE